MVSIIYSTMTGNTRRVVQSLAKYLTAAKEPHTILEAPKIPDNVLSQSREFIIASPTWNVGEIPEGLSSFVEKLEQANLTGVKFGIIALGDKKFGEYYFCNAGKKIAEIITKKQGRVVGDIFEIDSNIEEFIGSPLEVWTNKYLEGRNS